MNSDYENIFIQKIIDRKKPKIHVFLDLDSTIINSLTPKEVDYCKREGFNPLEKFTYHEYYYKKKLEFYIFERPNLQPFLDYLFENYDVSVFTAAQDDYAKFIVDNIIENNTNRRLKYFFYSYHADITYNYMRGLKDLNIFWSVYGMTDVKPCNTIILDDNLEVYYTNKINCILVPEFSIISEDDDDSSSDDEDEALKSLSPSRGSIKYNKRKVNKDMVEDRLLFKKIYNDIQKKLDLFTSVICPLHFPIGHSSKDAICKLDKEI
jgi:TFIIF-interacting CTD phosphatase-like protein